MGEQRQRDYRLEVGPAGGKGREFTPPQQITFEVEQGMSRGIDRVKITLTNLDDDDQNFLLARGLRVILHAGYISDGLGLIFAGQVSQRGVRTGVVHTRDTTTFTASIEAGSGEIALQETRFDRSYAPNITNVEIIDDIAAALGVRVRSREQIPERAYSTGWAHAGTASAALGELADSVNGDWSIRGEDLFLLGVDQTTSEQAAVVSPDTGLLGRPVLNVNGIDFKSRLNYRLRPGRRAKLESDEANGTYRLNRLTHSGDLRNGPWVSTAFCRFPGS